MRMWSSFSKHRSARAQAGGLTTIVAAVLAMVLAIFYGATSSAKAADETPPEIVNVAAQNSAHEPEVSVSYVPAWNSAAALNNGSTKFGGHGDVWGTYGDFRQQHWAQYEWDVPVTVSSTNVWFWNDYPDPGNVLNPASWKLQYWDDKMEAFVDIAATYPIATGSAQVLGPNSVTFDPVTTTKMRMVLNAQARGTSWYSVASVEWELMGYFDEPEPEPVDPAQPVDIEDVHVRTLVGQVPELPATVWVLPENGPLGYADVTWDSFDTSAFDAVGDVEVAGVLTGKVTKVHATIHVVAELDSTISDVAWASTLTTPGVAPVCPNTVDATYADNSRSTLVPVTWDDVDPAEYAEAEQFGDIYGTVEGYDGDVLCTFWVVEPVEQGDVAPFVQIDVTNSPNATGWFTELPVFSVIAQERTSPIASVEYSIDGGDTWDSYANLPVTVDKQGEVTIQARALDTEGREGTASTTVKIDTIAPETHVEQSVSGDGKVVTLTLSGSDGEQGSGVSRIVYSMGPSADPESSENDMWATYDEPFTVAKRDVPMYVHIRAQDVAGNQEETQSVTIDPLSAPEDPTPVPDPEGNVYFQDAVTDKVARTAMQVASADEVLAGDWDGDGVDTLALRHGTEYTFLGSNRTGATEVTVDLGAGVPVVGDFNGDGKDDLALRAVDSNLFSITYNVGGAIPAGVVNATLHFGKATDTPVAGDWDGNGTDTLGVQHGNQFFLSNSLAGGNAEISFFYGRVGDTPLAGDFDGDGRDTIAVSRGYAVYVKNTLTKGDADITVNFGRSTDYHVAGDWFGTGTDTVAVVR